MSLGGTGDFVGVVVGTSVGLRVVGASVGAFVGVSVGCLVVGRYESQRCYI